MKPASNDRTTAQIFLRSLTPKNAEKVAAALAAIQGTTNQAVVLSDSMYPTLQVGDIVHIDTTQQIPKSGDVIVFVRQNMQVVHRVMFVRGNYLYTKGDASMSWDIPVPLTDIIGIVSGLSSKRMVFRSIAWGVLRRIKNRLIPRRT